MDLTKMLNFMTSIIITENIGVDGDFGYFHEKMSRNKKAERLTAPKKTWGGQWFPQGSFFVAIFATGGQFRASKSPTFLSCNTLPAIRNMKLIQIIFVLSIILVSCKESTDKNLDNSHSVDETFEVEI